MIKIIKNKDNLKEEDMTVFDKRYKAIILDNDNNIIIGYSFNNYQLIGGHKDNDESDAETLNREIKEETGIELDLKDISPFAVRYEYCKDWPSIGENKKIENYYFKVITDKKVDLNNTKYTESEKKGNFEVRIFPLKDLRDKLMENLEEEKEFQVITREILELLDNCEEKLWK